MLRQFAISIALYPNLCTSSTDSDSAIATCSTVKPIASSWGIVSCWSCFARSKPERYTHKMTIPIPAETILSNKSPLSGWAIFKLCCDRSPLPTSKRAINYLDQLESGELSAANRDSFWIFLWYQTKSRSPFLKSSIDFWSKQQYVKFRTSVLLTPALQVQHLAPWEQLPRILNCR